MDEELLGRFRITNKVMDRLIKIAFVNDEKKLGMHRTKTRNKKHMKDRWKQNMFPSTTRKIFRLSYIFSDLPHKFGR